MQINWTDVPTEVIERYNLKNIEDTTRDYSYDQQSVFLRFLQGQDIEVTEDTYPIFRDHGFNNDLGYDLKFYSIRLMDRWIRDMMYPMKLYEQDRYGLIPVDVKVDDFVDYAQLHRIIDYITSGDLVIAGGACVSFIQSTELNDVDVFFTCSEERAREILKELTDNGSIHECWLTERATTLYKGRIQFIHRTYRSISEVVHGFDLDSCGIVFDGDKFWWTKRTKYSHDNTINHFDPSRASPSYIHRLIKYSRRGYRVVIPQVSRENIKLHLDGKRAVTTFLTSALTSVPYFNMSNRMKDLRRDINVDKQLVQERCWYNSCLNVVVDPNCDSLCHHAINVLCERMKRVSGIDLMENGLPSRSIIARLLMFRRGAYTWCGIVDEDILSFDDDEFILSLCSFISRVTYEPILSELDDKSLLILSSVMKSDILPRKTKDDYDSQPVTSLKDITFNSQDPMTQVTSTWEPEVINNMSEWLSSAKVYTTDTLENEVCVDKERFKILPTMKELVKISSPDGLILDSSVQHLFKDVSMEEFKQIQSIPKYVISDIDLQCIHDYLEKFNDMMEEESKIWREKAIIHQICGLMKKYVGIRCSARDVTDMLQADQPENLHLAYIVQQVGSKYIRK